MSEEQISAALAAARPASAIQAFQPDKKLAEQRSLAVDDIVEALNFDHALVLTGGRAAVLFETFDAIGRPKVELMSIDAFKQYYGNRHVTVGKKQVSIAEVWLDHPSRRSFQGIVFAPGEAPEGYYNTWRGFDVDPAPGDWSLFRDHLFANVCGGDQRHFNYIFGWFADLVQNPTRKHGTALVLRGKQGVGKTKVGEVFGSLFSSHYCLVDSPHLLTGAFNGHMEATLLMQVEEGFWAGDKEAEGRLKSLITGGEQLIERKFQDAYKGRNLVRLLITSNAEWVVPAGMDERRFAVFDVGTAAQQNREYFKGIQQQLDCGGRAGLLHDLLTFDLSKVDIRHIPRTPALDEQVIASFNPMQAWWFECLSAGSLVVDGAAWPTRMECHDLFKAFMEFGKVTNINPRSVQTRLGMELKRMCPGMRKRATTRPHAYELPDLEACRGAFDAYVGWDYEWDSG
ncbi:MAG: primase-helicase family protein [Magnetospiraceae bacterium]